MRGALPALLVLMLGLAAPGARAATSGQLFLRGEVPPRATVGLSATPVHKASYSSGAETTGNTAIMLAPVSGTASAAILYLKRLANSASGFVVKLGVGSAAGGSPVLTDAAGTSIPYKVKFAGREIEFSGGEADLAVVTDETDDDDAGGKFEILAPAIPVTGSGFVDQIVLIVAAR